MKQANLETAAIHFWNWFGGFAARLPEGEPPEEMLDELLGQLHALDERIYFELSTDTPAKELILTAHGDVAVFPVIEAIVDAAPVIETWSFMALTPPMGFDFTHRNNGIELHAAKLWFLPLRIAAQPDALGLRIGVPDADLVIRQETVDTASTILQTGIGERSYTMDIQYIELVDLPDDPAAHGYIELPQLAQYIAWEKQRRTNATRR